MFQQDPVLKGLVPALDFALGLRVVWRTATVPSYLCPAASSPETLLEPLSLVSQVTLGP